LVRNLHGDCGPAGVTAAMVLQERGFSAVLFDPSPRLGGMLNVADKGFAREKITRFVDSRICFHPDAATDMDDPNSFAHYVLTFIVLLAQDVIATFIRISPYDNAAIPVKQITALTPVTFFYSLSVILTPLPYSLVSTDV